MNHFMLLTAITFCGSAVSQFIPLSPSGIYNNHAYSMPSLGSLGCNIACWYSTYHQKNIFMISYFNAPSGKVPLLKSDILSFSMNYSHDLQTSFNISDTYINNIQDDGHLMDVVTSSSSIMVLSQVRDSTFGDQYLFYRIISNYQYNIQDIYLSSMTMWKIPQCSASGHYCKVTASKLYGSALFIIVYQNYNSLLYYLVNENTANPLSATPNTLVSQIDLRPSNTRHDTAFVTGIRVRASKTNERYLIIWSASYYLRGENYTESIQASLHTNDGIMVNSMKTIVTQTTATIQRRYTLYDAISFNISAELGLYAILYYDASLDSGTALCLRILNDSASNVFANDTIISVQNQTSDKIQSATIRVLNLVSPPPYKLYLVVSWSYSSGHNPGAVYVQMLEFSWTSSMEQYHLYPEDVPFEVFSMDQTWRRVCMDSVDNQLLVASFGDTRKTYTQLLTTTITKNPTVAPTNDPTVAPTKHPTISPTNNPTKAPVTDDPTHKPTDAPTKNPTDTTNAPTTHAPTTYTKEPSRSPIVREKIIVQRENKKQYLLLLMIIPFIIFCGYRIKQYMSFVIVDKALILIIGIRRFDGDQLSELPGIESNVDDLRRLWFDTYHYTVKVCNESTLKCTKRDIIGFIDKYKYLLEDTNYKAVIVHILSHGSGDDTFLTSDLKTMQTSFFEHELITITEFAGHSELIKLIFHHACRGHADYFEAQEIDRGSNNKLTHKFSVELKEIISSKEKLYGIKKGDHKAVPLRTDSSLSFMSKQRKEADAHSNCAVLYGTIEDRALSDDGHFTESICKVFGTNSRDPIKRDLYGLIREIGSDLETRTHSAQICSSKGIGTLRNKIRFQKCTNKIRYRETN